MRRLAKDDLRQQDSHDSPLGSCSSLYQTEWWLRAASNDQIETVEVKWDSIAVGRQSFLRTRRWGGFTHLGMPLYTRTLGPILTLPHSSVVQRSQNARRVVGELLALLPPHDRFHQQLDPRDDTAIAFALNGCATGQDYSFRIPATASASQLLAQVVPETRRLIKACARSMTLQTHFDLDRFVALARRDHPDERCRHDFAVMRRIFEAARAHGQTSILSVLDETGRDVASAIVVWGGGVLYYWLPQRDRTLARSGANAFLLWKAVEFALGRGLEFDFDGFGSVGAARFMSGFGVAPVIRPVVVHSGLRGLTSDFVHSLLRRRPQQGGIRPDPTVRISFENARAPRRATAG